MAKKKNNNSAVNITIGDIQNVSGELNIAARDIYKGYTAEQVSVLLTQIRSTFQPKPFDGRCPYKGLDVFEEEDAELFFGREKLVKNLVSRVKESRTVFITGPSGSGKSSLVRAGLIHALKQGAIKDLHSERWLYETIKPGRDPLEALASAFSRLKSPELEDYFRKHLNKTSILTECAESALSGQATQRLVLFVDQFEEVFTQVGKDKAAQFLDALTDTAVVENGRVIILFSMRSDFVSDCAMHPKLNSLLNKQFVQIGAMQPDELASAIAQPALRVGLQITPDLIAQIINDMQGEPGTLPLMEFALSDLFEAQQSKGNLISLTLNDYLARGGINQSLKRHADEVFKGLSQVEQDLARTIFSGLVLPRGGTKETTRRTALFEELVPAGAEAVFVKAVIQKLEDGRLVTMDETNKDKYTLAHEKLISAWSWLDQLVSKNREAIALKNEIDNDAKEWDTHKRDASYLYSGGRLANVHEQLERQKLVPSQLAQEFVKAGRKRQRRAQVFTVTAVSLILIAAILASVVFQNQSRVNFETANTAQAASTFAIAQQGTARANADEANKQANIAFARQLASEAQALDPNEGISAIRSGLLAVEAANRGGFGWIIDSALRRYLKTAGLPIASMRHEDKVTCVVFSKDGNYVASGSVDGTARVWEANTGKEVARMNIGKEVTSIAFSPDESYIVTGSADNTARVWEIATSHEVSHMTHDGSGGVRTVEFSPDGIYVVSGSDDKTARLWEAKTAKEITRMNHDGGVILAVFAQDGNYAMSASAGSDHATVHVWETRTGKETIHMTHEAENSDVSVAFSSDAQYVVTGSLDGTIIVWDAITGQELIRIKSDGWIESLSISRFGAYVAAASFDGTIRIWEVASGNEIARMHHSGNVTSLTFVGYGEYLASGSVDGTARVWKVSTGEEVVRMNHESGVDSVDFMDYLMTYVSGSDDGVIRVWRAVIGNELTRMDSQGTVNSVAYSPDGEYIVSGSDYDLVHVWKAESGQELQQLYRDSAVKTVGFSDDGDYIASGDEDGIVRAWEAKTGQQIAQMNCGSEVVSVGFSSNSEEILSGSVNGIITRWNVKTSQELGHWNAGSEITSAAFGPKGNYAVTGNEKGNAIVWDLSTGQELNHLNHEGRVNSVAFSPDDSYVVSGSVDGTARVWDIKSGQQIARMNHASNVVSVAFSPNEKYILTGDGDGNVRVWDVNTSQELSRANHGNKKAVTSVSFSPNGQYILSGSEDSTVRIWYWKLDDLIYQACERLPRNFTSIEWAHFVGVGSNQAVCTNLPFDVEPAP